jgi:hypothetical protein
VKQGASVQNPFESVESAQQYIALLVEQVEEVEGALIEDMAQASPESRRAEALHLVKYKLSQLKMHLSASSRMLNDLRALRRLLLNERQSSRRSESSEGAQVPVSSMT